MKKRIILALLSIVVLVNMFLPAHAGVNGDSLEEHDWELIDRQSGLVPRFKIVASCELEPFEHSHRTLAVLVTLKYQCVDCGEIKEVNYDLYNEPWVCSLHDAG